VDLYIGCLLNLEEDRWQKRSVLKCIAKPFTDIYIMMSNDVA